MTQQGGDRAYPTGDAITVINAEGSSISPGDWVMVTGHTGDHPEVELSDSNDSNPLLGVVKRDAGGADDGEPVAVQLRGAVWANVASGVSAGDELGNGTTAGQAESGGSSGFYALDSATTIDGEDYAPVLLN